MVELKSSLMYFFHHLLVFVYKFGKLQLLETVFDLLDLYLRVRALLRVYLGWEQTNTDLFYSTHNTRNPIQACAWVSDRCICIQTSRQNVFDHFFKCQNNLKNGIELALISLLRYTFHYLFYFKVIQKLIYLD